MSVKVIAGVGLSVVVMAALGSGVALATANKPPTLRQPKSEAHSLVSESAKSGCLLGTVDGTVLSEDARQAFLTKKVTPVLYREPEFGSYWALFPSTGVGPASTAWTARLVVDDSPAARATCAPFFHKGDFGGTSP
jgi:hypothetical protein